MTVGPSAAVVMASVVAAMVIVPPLLARWARPPRPVHCGPRSGDTILASTIDEADRRGRGSPTSRPERRRRRVPVTPDVVANWLDDVARATRVGSGLTDALVRVPDAATERSGQRSDRASNELGNRLSSLQRRLRRGDSLSAALTSWRDTLHPNDDALTTAATVLIAANDVGGSVAVPLERAAALLRARAAEADERSASSAQARLSARVLGVLPIAVLGVLLIVDRDVAGVLGSPIGAMLVGAGVLLDVVGFLWMRRIVRRAGR